MCGNDGLQARTSFKSQTGTCNYSVLDTAVNNCKTYVAAAMDYINANAYAGTKLKVIANLYYPGYNADNVQSACTDADHRRQGQHARQVPARASRQMNYWMCEYARQKGFKCADNFAQYMGADYDSNGDGQVDSDALRYVAGESEAGYVTRITSTLSATMRDANTHFVSATSSYDYIQSDDTHPTYTGGTVTAGLFGGTTGSGAPRYTSFTGGKSPIWNQYGHERMGWALSTYNPPAPVTAAAADPHGRTASHRPDAADPVERRRWRAWRPSLRLPRGRAGDPRGRRSPIWLMPSPAPRRARRRQRASLERAAGGRGEPAPTPPRRGAKRPRASSAGDLAAPRARQRPRRRSPTHSRRRRRARATRTATRRRTSSDYVDAGRERRRWPR